MCGKKHPCGSGRRWQYLPTANAQEAETARINIQSATGDLACVYARLVGRVLPIGLLMIMVTPSLTA